MTSTRVVVIMDWNHERDETTIEAFTKHRSLFMDKQTGTGTPIAALRSYIEHVEETEARWRGIPE